MDIAHATRMASPHPLDHRQRPTAKVIVLTMLDDDESGIAAIRAGARGYVLRAPNALSAASRQSRRTRRGTTGEAVAKRVRDHLAAGTDPLPATTTKRSASG